MATSKFNVGDRVVYAYRNDSYNIGESNPLVGTLFECAGVVTTAYGLRVSWDNGSENTYQDSDLEFEDRFYGKGVTDDPNILFRRKEGGIK